MHHRRAIATAAIGAFVLPSGSLLGQETWPSAPAWSPIASRANIERQMPFGAPETLALWTLSVPFGLFRLTGNPASLGWETVRERSDYAVDRQRVHGAYRRPLDPTESSVATVEASGAARPARNGSVLGSIRGETERLSPGPRVDQSQPFGSSPLVLADTAAAAMSSSAVRIVGAGGWSLGRWAAGIAGGYDTQSLHTNDAGFVRQTQITTPGVVLGIALRPSRSLGVVVGAHAGTRRQSQTTNFLELTSQGLLYQLAGFRDSPPIVVQQSYYQRFDEHTEFAGAEVGGDLVGARWAVGAEESQRRDITTHAEATAALMDRWRANGTAITGGVERAFSGAVVRLQVRSTPLRGALRTSNDSVAPSLTARERESSGEVAVITPVMTRVTALLSVSVLDERLMREDTLNGVRLDLHWRDPVISASASYDVGSRTALLLGVARGWHNAAGHIPRASDFGSVYRLYVAPEIALYASPGNAMSLQLGLRSRLTQRVTASLMGEQASASPQGIDYIGQRPGGDRVSQRVELAISVIPPG